MKNIHIVASIVGLSLLFAACAGTVGAPTLSPAGTEISPAAGGTQTSEGGQVTVVATWNGAAAGAVFDIKLDTHSMNLDALDLSNAVLRNDRGQTLTALPWTATKGGHHREGTLRFGGDAATLLAGAKWIELILAGVGDIAERTLRWEIGS